MMPFGLIIGLLSSQAGKLGDRIGARPMLLVGSLVVAAGVAGLAFQFDNFWLGVELPLCIMALGMAIVVSPLTTTVMNSVSDARAGTASGINNTASRLAGLFAIAGAGACAALLFQAFNRAGQGQFGLLPDADASGYDAIVSAYQLAYAGSLTMLAAGALGAALIAAWWIPSKSATQPIP